MINQSLTKRLQQEDVYGISIHFAFLVIADVL